MEKYDMSKSDCEDISFLINTSKAIKDIYNKLINLEKENAKDSEVYNSCLKELKSLLEIEENIYKKLDNSTKEKYISYLKNLNEYRVTNKSYEILFDNNINLEILRVLLKLDKNKNYIDFINDVGLDKYDNGFQFLISKLIEDNKKIFYQLYLDNLRCFLAILDKENHNTIDSEYVNIIYRISFLFSEIEDELIQNKFKINNEPYLLAKMFIDMYNQDEKLLNSIRYIIFSNHFKLSFYNIQKYYDYDLKNNDVRSKIIIQSYYIRSLIIVSDEETVNEVKELFFYGTYDLLDLRHDSQVLELFGDCFNHQKEDVEIPKIVSLKRF